MKEQSKINGTAHSNVRRGLNDYNDGGSLTHHLGNDDFKDGNNQSDPYSDSASFDGSEAQGNDLLEDDEYQEEDYEEFEEDQNRA